MEEIVRLNRFTVDGEPKVDIRWWKITKLGPRPTTKGLVIPQNLVVRLMFALSKMNEQFSSESAKETEKING